MMMDNLDKTFRTTAGKCSSFHVLDGDDYFSDASDSDAESECSDCSYETIDSGAEGETSSLFTIQEETEEDLMSRGSCDFDLSDDRSEMSPIQTPRIRISLGAYLERDERRRQSNKLNLDLTTHEVEDENATDATSESLDTEEACLQESFASFGFDESKSSNSSSNASLKSLSCSSLGNIDDAKSVDSSSTTGSNKIALLKLQRSLSAGKLKRAIEAAELSSSFRKDELTTSKCIDSLEMSLLRSPEHSRATEQYREARSNLLSVMSASKHALMVQLE